MALLWLRDDDRRDDDHPPTDPGCARPPRRVRRAPRLARFARDAQEGPAGRTAGALTPARRTGDDR